MVLQLKQVHSRILHSALSACGHDDIAQGKAQLLQVLRRSTSSRQQWVDAAAGLCLGGHLADATEYAKAIEEACGYRKLWQVALAALQELRDRGISRNVAVYLAAIRSCGKSAWRRALCFLQDINDDGMEQGLISHKAALKVLEHAGRWQEVLAMLQSMQTSGPPPGLEEYSLALRVCSNASRNEEITEALRECLDAFIYRDQMECYRKDEWQQVLALLQEIAERDLAPDRVVCSSAIQILEANSLWVSALQLLAKSRKAGLVEDGLLYGAVIRSCLRDNRLEEAITLMKEAMQEDLRPDMATYEAMIFACSTMGEWKWALFFWKDMLQEKEGQTTAAVHESLMVACQAAGEWQWVLAISKDMEKASVQPSIKAYEVAISACQEAKQPDWVDQLKQKLVALQKAKAAKMHLTSPVAAAGLESAGDISQENLHTSLQACAAGSWEAALQLLRNLQGRRIQADGMAFNSVITACQKGSETQKALALMEEMQEENFDPDTETYSELVSALQPEKAKETPAAIRQSWSMAPGSFRIVRSPKSPRVRRRPRSRS